MRKYRKAKQVKMMFIPLCDFCLEQGASPPRQGIYDSPTHYGPWASMCDTHMHEHGIYSPELTRKRVIRGK